VAAAAAWLLYAGIYAITFRLGGSSPGMAIRAGLANALPDGLLALAALRISRAVDRGHPAGAPFVRRHLLIGAPLIVLAAAGKMLLLWADIALHGGVFQINPGLASWQIFLSALIYVTVAATSHAWLMARRLREEEAHAARADTLRAQAEMAALRAQLNPHFLFNTLHSTLGLVRRDPAQAEAALEKLGDLLRYATRVHRNGVDWTSLRHELEFTDTYLDLEAIRLGARLSVVRNIDAAALDRQVPTFSVQPLVENAVRHGIAPQADGGKISITASVGQDTIKIQVMNDTPRRSGPAPEASGMGQRVLRERLEALYRGAATMNTREAAGTYTVDVLLPHAAEARE
jgi:hypothetical protein